MNDYFVNVANENAVQRPGDGVNENTAYRNSSSIFIRSVDEKETLDTVKTCKI